MMKKINILILNGSYNKNGITSKKIDYILQQFSDLAIENNLIIAKNILDLEHLNITICKGCSHCFFKGYCTIEDNITIVANSMLSADVIIIATPVYLNHISSGLKVILDRLAYWAHLMPLITKRGIIITTASQSGLDETTNYLEKILPYFGISIDLSWSYNRFLDINSLSRKEIYDGVKECISKVMSENYHLTTEVLNIFNFFKEYYIQNQDLLKDNYEYNYWKKQGYLDKDITLEGGEKDG